MDFEKRISDYGMTPEQYEASFAFLREVINPLF